MDCLDNIQRGPENFIESVFKSSECVLRTYRRLQHRQCRYRPTLEAAIEAFDMAPIDTIPRVIRDGKTLVERDPEDGLAPIF